MFEIKICYPEVSAIVLEYRGWLIKEVYKLLLVANMNVTQVDAEVFMFVVDEGMVQLLSDNKVK